ncbi:putative glycolipid-binding domain-containing protein [Marimonas sp. MJW-29]|uniref:Glycolipid-binding domain-containing protein n=1 Tax=Sulfitobacter sediminis TaxID=3234186 RepID=A0ABV3RJZ7_9RHOB
MSLPEDFAGAIVWEWQDGTFDRARFDLTPTGWDITGRHGETRYVIKLNTDHEPTSLEATCGDRTLSLRRTAGGWRDDDGTLLPNSAGARDLDLGWTAVTNSFPIRRLMARRRGHGRFDVLLVALPDLDTRIVRQSYAREGKFWLYVNHDSGFSARLEVDNHGLVIDYPGLCTRRD